MHVAEPNSPQEIIVSSLQGDYPVIFRKGIAAGLDCLETDSETLVVVDANVLDLHQEVLGSFTSQFPTYVVLPSESAKSLTGVQALVDWLIAHRAVRSSSIVAIGGGCVQDLVSFTAHIYYRGIAWRFLPTTILSQADSCIGAKSGINVLPFKNQLGVLHSPTQVVLCEEFLSTLPDREVASGYGEIVKLSVTSSHHFLAELERALREGGLRNESLLELEAAALMAKQEVIEQDEYELDLRRVLNYGHSFGHALEALSGHTIPHGLAVLWGIDVINSLGVHWGVTPPDLVSRLHRLIDVNFDYVLDTIPAPEALVDMLRRDKKVSKGVMNFVLLRDLGDLVIHKRVLDDELVEQVGAVLSERRVFSRS